MPTYRLPLRLTGLALLAACAARPEPDATLQPATQPAAERPSNTATVTVPARVPEYSIRDFLATTNVTGAAWSPDRSKILVSSDESGIYNAYAIPVDGSPRVQLTHSTTDGIYAYAYFPNDERFLYGSDQGGNELTHIYVRERDGTVKDLTPGAKLKAQFAGFADDKRSFFVATNERDPRFFDLYEYAVDGYARTLLFQNDGGYYVGAVSPDKRWIALEKPRTTSDSDVWLYGRQTKKLENLTPHTGVVSNNAATFSKDSKALYLITDQGKEFAWLARHDLTTGQRSTVLEPSWDVTYAMRSQTGRYLVVGINTDARTEVRVYDAATMQPVALPTLPDADITSVAFAPDDSRIAFYASDSRSPRDLFVAQLGGAQPMRLTRTLSPKIDAAHLVDGKVVRFKSYDGVEVPGILYVPHQATPLQRAPALVMVHGGPGGQARVGYKALAQYLVNHGYVVFDINNRGSSGYGKTFYAMDDRRHGEADLGDVVESKKMLASTGVVDPERIGIIGGSYGGYMVLAALAFQPEAFDVGVDIFGVANWVRTLESIPSWWEAQREALYTELGNPKTDAERLRRISPLFHAANIRKPLIVLQGANDPRVLKVESDEIVEAVKKNGVPVEYVVFPDEGHGFTKKANQESGYESILTFVNRHLRDQGATP